MELFFNRSRYYLKLLYAFLRISLLNQLEYRLNFVSGLAVETAFMCIKMTYLVVVLRTGVNIGNLTPDMVMILIGSYCLMTGILCFLWGIAYIPQKALAGELDRIIVKPGSLMFMLTLSSFDFAMTIPNAGVGIALICIGWGRAGLPISFELISGFVLFSLTGIVMTYAFLVVQALLVFWVTSVSGTFAVAFALWDFNNMPMALYGKTVQRIGTFILPIFVITNWAGLFVLRELNGFEIAWGLSVPVIVMLLTRFMWNRGLRRYTSAGG